MAHLIRCLVLLSGLGLAVVVSGCAPAAHADRGSWRPAAWVEMTGAGAVVRAVAPGGECPLAVIDGQGQRMGLRRAAGDIFPAVCQLDLPVGAASLSVDGAVLPLPVHAPQRIVMMGDSGCRMQGAKIQSCNDAKAWPFAAVASLAAAQKPDLVIHVGDYYYRETACPPLTPACAGSPYGDNWDTWQAEFFEPAAPLLAAAPWVFVRGNHETCDRGGPGWFLLLDAGAQAQDCPARSAPFAIDIGGLNLYVLDSANSDDRGAQPRGVDAFARQIDALGGLNQGKGWLVTHRPVWGEVPVLRIGPLDPIEVGINLTEQAAVRGRTLGGVQMIVSGHIHDFSALSFGVERPAQLIVGTGGDVGESADLMRVRSGPRHIDGQDADFFTFDRFGYLVLDRQGDDWSGAFHDAEDRVVATCKVHERTLKCVQAQG